MKQQSRFADQLRQRSLSLARGVTTTLQVNVGRVCDLACRHCHLEAGPLRTELMSHDTAQAVIGCARRLSFQVIDITGGAPELLPHLPLLVRALAPLTGRLIVRTNLTALALPQSAGLPELYRDHGVHVVASLPAANRGQTEAQRGQGVWERSIRMLQELNAVGYGIPGSGLTLDLVSNPAGAFLPAGQQQAEARFRCELESRHGIRFTSLLSFANSPLGRFRRWLESSGNLDGYCGRLEAAFNPAAVPDLMCRSILSVDWDGILYDCDFNIAAGLPHSGRPVNVERLSELPLPGMEIPVADHCYACAAGSGFT